MYFFKACWFAIKLFKIVDDLFCIYKFGSRSWLQNGSQCLIRPLELIIQSWSGLLVCFSCMLRESCKHAEARPIRWKLQSSCGWSKFRSQPLILCCASSSSFCPISCLAAFNQDHQNYKTWYIARCFMKTSTEGSMKKMLTEMRDD